jgi:hypothetical protein
LIIERPVCASTSEFEYVTIDSKTLTLLWSPPGAEISADKWKSKLLHFQEFGNPPKADCDVENGEFCEDFTGNVQIYFMILKLLSSASVGFKTDSDLIKL